MAAIGFGVMAGGAAMIVPPEMRRWTGGGLVCAIALFVARTLISHNPRLVLWFAFTLGVVLGLSLLVLIVPHGRVAYQAMSYTEQRNRGFVCMSIFVVLGAAVIAGSIFWVH